MKKCKLLIAGVVCGAFVMQTGLTGVYASEQSTICYEARQSLNISAKADTNKINVGGKVTLTGTAVGGTAPYTYSYLVHNKDTNDWARLTPEFVKNASFTWTAGSVGNREFFVEAKDSTGKVVRSSAIAVSAVKELELTIGAKADTNKVNVGDKVTLTGTATGGTAPYTYSYLVHNKDTGSWARLTPEFVKNASFIWTAGSVGNREFFVEAKDSTGKVVRSSAVAVSAVKAQNLTIGAKSDTNKVNVGDKVTLTGTATGGTAPYTYSYLVHNKDTNDWARLTPEFVKNASFIWTAGSVGNREFFVEAKDSTGKVVRSSAVAVSVAKVQNLTISAKTDKNKVNVGDKVTLTGTAAGGTAPYTYSYLVYNKDTGSWARLTPQFVKSASFTWTAGSVGNREFFVEAKDSTGKVVRSSAIAVSTVKAQALTITAKIDKNKVNVGDKVTLTGTATGGTAPYTYSYLVHNKDTDSWARLTPEFVKNASFTWTAGSAGNREFFVEVKDSTGKVVRSSAMSCNVIIQQEDWELPIM